MKKAVIDKKIQAFKEVFPYWKQSQRTDSIYARVNERKHKKVISYHGRSITKNLLKKYGTESEFETTFSDVVYLITSRGKLMYSLGHGARSWRNTTLKHVREYNGWANEPIETENEEEQNLLAVQNTKRQELQIKDVFFIGKKYEWMKDYPEFWNYKFFMSFSSLKEAKNFLGFTYICNSRFYGMFKGKPGDVFDDILQHRDNKNIVNLLNKLDKDSYHMLTDYKSMCKQEGIAPEIPKGYNKLRKLHDEISEKQNQELLKYTSKECIIFPKDTHYEEVWKERGLRFKRVTDPYSLRLIGCRQHHCIGSYYNHIFNMGVYSFFEGGKEYNLAFDSNSGNVSQFRGYRNCKAPDELYSKVTEDINLKHEIIRKTELPKHYPYIKSRESISKEKQILMNMVAVADGEDLPF